MDSDTISPTVLELYEHHRDRNTSPSVEELSQSLLTTIESFKEVFLVVDALDECSDKLRWDLVEQLDNIQPEVHLLITSRYLDSINEELETFARFEIKAHRSDIELFIDHQIKKNRNLRKIVDQRWGRQNSGKYVPACSSSCGIIGKALLGFLSSMSGRSWRLFQTR